MAKKRTSFLMELDKGEVFDNLTNEEAGKLIKAIYDYERCPERKLPEMDKMTKLLFLNFKAKLDSNEEEYNLKCEKNRLNVEKRWENYNKNKGNEEKNTTEYDRIPSYTTEYDPLRIIPNKRKEIKRNEIKENKKETTKEKKENDFCGGDFNLINFFEENEIIYHNTPEEINILERLKEVPKEILEESVEVAKIKNNTKFNYIYGIVTKKLKEEKEKNNLKGELPSWFDKEIKNSELTDDVKKEMEDLLAGFD